MSNTNLIHAKRQKNDEFYTQLRDIEKEMQAYLDYDPDVFRDKTVLLPCDDPTWSNFTKYFALNFEQLGLKKLISTSYSPCGGHGKVFTLGGENELQWAYLTGDGDFRSAEVTALRDEADIVITNPPFSLFREFVVWLTEGGVLFSVIGSMNAITYKEVFPLIKDNKLWLGRGKDKGGNSMWFEVPEDYPQNKHERVEDDGTRIIPVSSKWFTNIEHGRRHEPLKLMTQAENEKYNKRIISNPNSYKKYDNYDAIEVPSTSGIPSDYTGVTGVPISFLDKHCPEQFEIVKFRHGDDGKDLRYTDKSGSEKTPYFRVLIRHINSAAQDAIEAPATSDTPSNHSGVMGVPISFLDKYCPEQFEIVGGSANGQVPTDLKIGDYKTYNNPLMGPKKIYQRIFIRHINPVAQEAAVQLAQVHTLETATPELQQMAA